jgi:lipopolysaccharide transport system permease protein
MTGLLPWTLFSVAVTSGISSLTSQSNLVTKTYFPREILPLASLAASALDFLIALLFLIAMMVFFKVGLSWNLFYAIPILMVEIFLTTGVTLFLSLVNVWYRDITHAAGLMLQLWMYLTPILYPFNLVPEAYRGLLRLNPMVGVVEGFRSAVIKGESPEMGLLITSFVISLLIFLAGYGLFKAYEFRLADVI